MNVHTTPAFDVPNLDCMTPQELAEFGELVNTLDAYARHLRHARRLRLAGDISTALSHEGACDRIYRELPQSARW